MASDIVDVAYLANHLGIEVGIISAAIDTPTTAHIQHVLLAVSEKARQADSVLGQKLQLETHLETVVRNSIDQARAVRADADQARQELASVQDKLREQELARAEAETSLEAATSQAQVRDAELDSLRSKFAELQRSANDSIAYIEQRSLRIDELTDELATSEEENSNLRRKIHTLSAQANDAESDVSSAKYTEKSLEHKLDLANRNADWCKSELIKKTEELHQFRYGKMNQIADLTRAYQESHYRLNSEMKSVVQLRARLDDSDMRIEALETQNQNQLHQHHRDQTTWANEKRELTRAAAKAAEKAQTRAEKVEARHKEELASIEERSKVLEDYVTLCKNKIFNLEVAAKELTPRTIRPGIIPPREIVDDNVMEEPDSELEGRCDGDNVCDNYGMSEDEREMERYEQSVRDENQEVSLPSTDVPRSSSRPRHRLETPVRGGHSVGLNAGSHKPGMIRGHADTDPGRSGPGRHVATIASEMARISADRSLARTTTVAMEVYSELKAKLAQEQKSKADLQSAYQEAIATLEATGPEIRDLREEKARSQAEIGRMSQFAEESNAAREAAMAALRKVKTQLHKSTSEIAILKTQIQDSGMQIRMLIFNLAAQEKGLDYLSREEQEKYERLAAGRVGDEDETVAGGEPAPTDVSDTDQYISERFIVYRDINQLQAQNMEITRTLRELSAKLEHEERLVNGAVAAKDEETIQRLKSEVANLMDEIRSTKSTMESYRAERNMFRGLVGYKGSPPDNQEQQPQLPPPSQEQPASTATAAGDGGSLDQGSGNLQNPITIVDDEVDGAAPTAPTAAVADAVPASAARDPDQLRRVLLSGAKAKPGSAVTAFHSQQVLFDDFRSDQAQIKQNLQDTIAELRADKGRLQADMAALASREAIATQRFTTLQSNFAALQGEIVQTRASHFAAAANAADLQGRLEGVSDELVSSNVRLESLRREAANLSAEKDLWREAQERLARDTDVLVKDNTRLTQALSDAMKMQNMREISQGEERRDAEARMSRLEIELAATRRVLTEQKSQTEALQVDLRRVREALHRNVSTTSTRNSEIEELNATQRRLKHEIQTLQDKLEEATARANKPVSPPVAEDPAADDSSVIREMGEEMDTLRRQLETTQSELETARAAVEHLREISKDLEKTLLSATMARGVLEVESQAIMDKEIAEGQRLSASVNALTDELNAARKQISNLEQAEADLTERQEADLVAHRTELARECMAVERLVEAARYHQEDMRAQAEVASKAQQEYEAELGAHAETEKQLQALHAEHHETKTELAVATAYADSAKTAFDQAEASYHDRIDNLTRQISHLQTRDEDGKKQIQLLLDQLDSLTHQVTSIRQARAATAEPLDPSSVSGAGTNTDPLATLDGLRELNSYLRREKEINEVQLDIKNAEAQRLQGQLDALAKELHDIRLVLEQERQAATAAASASASAAKALPHAELMEKLGELNAHRERSAGLRAELEQTQIAMATRAAEADSLLAQIQSLQAEVEGLRAGNTHLEDELAAVRHDRDEWQRRTEAIIAKYPGAAASDPVESEQLKKAVADLQATLETERAGWASTREKLVAQFKERSKRLTGERNEALVHAKSNEDRLAAVQAEADGSKGQVVRLEARIQQIVSQTAAPEISTSFVVQLQQRIGSLERQLENVTAEKATVEVRLEKAERAARAAAAEAATKIPTAPAQQQLRHQLAVAESTVTSLQSRLVVLETATKDLEQSRADAEAKASELEANQTKIIKDRSDKMKMAFNDRLKESRTKLEDDFALKLEQEKAAWEADQLQLHLQQQESTSAPLDEAIVSPPMAHQPSPIISEAGIMASSQPAPSADVPTTQDEMLAALPDAEVRRFLSTNVTVKSIVANNIKKRVDLEAARLRAEYEPKIQSARESAEELARKRGLLRINMAEKRLGLATTRLSVVEKAAGETPLRPVAEVWAEAKEAKEEPTKEAPVPASATAASSPAPAATAGQISPFTPGGDGSALASPAVPTGPAATQIKNGPGHHGRGRGGKPRGGAGGGGGGGGAGGRGGGGSGGDFSPHGGQGTKRPRGHSEAAGMDNAAAEDPNKRPREG